MLFVGNDWAEGHHDVVVLDDQGKQVAKARFDEGVDGLVALHALLVEHLPGDAEPDRVLVGIETDRGPWVQALVAAGYRVFGVNPRQVARFKERYSLSGAKNDVADAHVLADMVRTDAHQLRQVAGDSDLAEGIGMLTRTHQNLIWDRTRHMLRLRSALREYFPAALEAFAELGLDGRDTLELLGKAADPDTAAGLSVNQIRGALKRAGRHKIDERAPRIQRALRTEQLRRPAVVAAAYAATTRSAVAILTALNEQVAALQGEVKAYFGRHPDAEILLSQPGLGHVLGARVLAEFGDDPDRYETAKARKNYAATSPITRQSGKKSTVHVRFIKNKRLLDPLLAQAQSALIASPGARAYYDQQRARGASHFSALRQLANRLVGILHGCLKHGTLYSETTAWSHHQQDQPLAAA
jgi:transposase